MDAFDEIRTARLLLRRLRSNEIGSQDLDWFHTVWSNDQATQWSPRGPCKTKQESSDWMAGIVPSSVPDDRTRIAYAVFHQSSSDSPNNSVDESSTWEIAGLITLLSSIHGDADDASRPGQPGNRAIEIGYLFLPSAWGHGFATESFRKFLEVYQEDLASTEEDVHVDLFAYVHARNAASFRVIQKLGLEEFNRFEKEMKLPLEQESSVESVIAFHKPLYETA
ncbi:GNAT domain-containing protein [Mariannaea sp. PMI_226]|nr:GNAT domain-containing protein [Mariannaea sp. PMI_226]